jgi:hypothetical protein
MAPEPLSQPLLRQLAPSDDLRRSLDLLAVALPVGFDDRRYRHACAAFALARDHRS